MTDMATPRRVLGVFAKQPTPGQVKTRLARETSPAWAATVAEAFLHDTLGRLAQIPAERVLAYAPADAEAYFAEVTGPAVTLIPQVEGDLGRRMAAFFQAQQDGGATSTVLVGTDSPTMPLEWIQDAFGLLDVGNDLVLGPATDGGYYLIGIGRRIPPIFDGMRWGTEQVLAETIARLPTDWKLALLPPWYDVDTLADWRVLRGHLNAMKRAGIDPGLPCTSRLSDY